MIDTNIIEKEYDIKDSQCNFGVGGLGLGREGEGKSEGGSIKAGGGERRGVMGGAYISLAIIKGGETRERGRDRGVRERSRVSLLIETPGLFV